MDSLLNSAGKRLFEKHLEQYAPVDPMYEFYTDARGKQKRRRVRFTLCYGRNPNADTLQRDIPPGLSARDAKILKSVQRRAHYLDSQ
jgi:hypothetical protein